MKFTLKGVVVEDPVLAMSVVERIREYLEKLPSGVLKFTKDLREEGVIASQSAGWINQRLSDNYELLNEKMGVWGNKNTIAELRNRKKSKEAKGAKN